MIDDRGVLFGKLHTLLPAVDIYFLGSFVMSYGLWETGIDTATVEAISILLDWVLIGARKVKGGWVVVDPTD